MLTMSEYRAFVREYSSAPFVFPGGGEAYLLLDDGEPLCAACAYNERKQIIWSIARGSARDGWCPVAICNSYNEDPGDRACAHCGADIGDQGEYSVIVGNIGTVFTGPRAEALAEYAEWCEQSRTGAGRAAGEPVTLTDPAGEPAAEHIPE